MFRDVQFYLRLAGVHVILARCIVADERPTIADFGSRQHIVVLLRSPCLGIVVT